MSGTKQRILDTARDLFNREGVHRVALRDVARAVGVSVGNLNYHFATKDDLVCALVLEVHEHNASTLFADVPPDFSPIGLYRTAMAAMHNGVAYRFVQLSYADAVAASSELQRLEASLAPKRRARSDRMIARLVENGFIDGRRFAPRADVVYEQGQLISSGWMAVAAVQRRKDADAIPHFAKLGVALLEPYATPKGVRQIRSILAGACDVR